ncbi:hypothetical protein HPG69_009975 [Diceros bicornis minor]|uniref:Uncharacterized protein n=1 Tax=Diceros bicornis minor TaxID=77932 RepID=A0A7J7EPU6_DICBM|nr:hypothetical protein HPG69_009975 [Diceros bicornis minor]
MGNLLPAGPLMSTSTQKPQLSTRLGPSIVNGEKGGGGERKEDKERKDEREKEEGKEANKWEREKMQRTQGDTEEEKISEKEREKHCGVFASPTTDPVLKEIQGDPLQKFRGVLRETPRHEEGKRDGECYRPPLSTKGETSPDSGPPPVPDRRPGVPLPPPAGRQPPRARGSPSSSSGSRGAHLQAHAIVVDKDPFRLLLLRRRRLRLRLRLLPLLLQLLLLELVHGGATIPRSPPYTWIGLPLRGRSRRRTRLANARGRHVREPGRSSPTLARRALHGEALGDFRFRPPQALSWCWQPRRALGAPVSAPRGVAPALPFSRTSPSSPRPRADAVLTQQLRDKG